MPFITITVGEKKLEVELLDTPTAKKLWEALPITGSANVWGDEIYFGIPVSANQEPDAREDVEVGTLAYWPVGSALCIFYGPTPVSQSDQPRAYSPVNILGKITGDATILQGTVSGTMVKVVKSA
jgi:hypothetical protein